MRLKLINQVKLNSSNQTAPVGADHVPDSHVNQGLNFLPVVENSSQGKG